jgi:hypothetical protein
VQGHNDRVAQYIRWHGLPRNTLKPWEKELFNPRGFFNEQSRIDAPKRLLASGPPVVSPDARNSVRPVARANDQGIPDGPLSVVITEGNVRRGEWYVRLLKGESDLLWGPEGSRLAVIRSTSEFGEKYSAFDLRTGRHLRDESWYDGKRYEGTAVAIPNANIAR